TVIDDLADDVLEYKAARARAVAGDDAGLEIGIEAAELALQREGVDAGPTRDDIGTRLGGDQVGSDAGGGQASDEVAVDLGTARPADTPPHQTTPIAADELILAEGADQSVIAETAKEDVGTRATRQ